MFKIFGDHWAGDFDLKVTFPDTSSELPVTHTIRRGDISVGLNAKEIPVFIRIRASQNVDPIFAELSELARQNVTPEKEKLQAIIRRCMHMAADLAVEHRTRFDPAEEIETQFSMA